MGSGALAVFFHVMSSLFWKPRRDPRRARGPGVRASRPWTRTLHPARPHPREPRRGEGAFPPLRAHSELPRRAHLHGRAPASDTPATGLWTAPAGDPLRRRGRLAAVPPAEPFSERTLSWSSDTILCYLGLVPLSVLQRLTEGVARHV